MLSDTAQYALRVALFLAEREGQGPQRVDDIAARLRVPRNYLSKTMHTMAQEGVLHSTRGPKGGFTLARSASGTRVLDVIEPFDDVGARRRCVLGRSACSDSRPCPAHGRWKPVADHIRDFYADTTLASLLE